MRVKAGIFIIIGVLLLMIPLVSAADPLIITFVSTSNQYPVANGADQAVLTVTVQNTTSGVYVAGANVTFNVDPLMGSFSPQHINTDASGVANTTFTVKTKSGTAHINVTAVYGIYANVNPTIIDQKIDHDSPYFYYPDYPQEGVVGTLVPFTATYTDFWGNPIDNVIKPGNHSVAMTVYGPSPDDSGFFESGFAHTITRDLDYAGNLSVNVRLTSGPGQNNIHLYPFGTISHKWEWITSETKGIPFSISEIDIIPSGTPPSQVVNGNFYVTYILYDRFGNIANNQTVNITSDGLGGPWYYTSNYEGKVYVTYSQPLAGTYLLKATTPANLSVTTNRTVLFYNANAAAFAATANPALVPSRDVNPSITSDITVTVMDIMGNPVKGENVTFSAPHNIVLDGTAASGPSVVDTLVVTDVNGDATTKFIPGAFVNATQPGYKSSATGSCLVTATWNGQSKDVQITWKNYPYLSAVVTLSKPVVFLNDTFDIRVRLNGDGWALHAKPIDVVLTTDRSGSMGGTKMTDAINAAKSFTGNLTDQDQEGLVSFSTYDSGLGDYTSTLDKGLTITDSAGRTSLKTTISGYSANGNTAMRSAIWRSANMIKNTARTDSVKAIVVLTDGEYNSGGDPQGGSGTVSLGDGVGTGSVITYSKNSGAKLYIIGLGVTSGYQTILTSYATQGNGKYYNAPNSSQLAQIYHDIAGELKTEAGVDTTGEFNLQTLTLNGASLPGIDAMTYIHDGIPTQAPGSTWIHKFNATNTSMNYIFDQTPEWNSDQKLVYNVSRIGTIHINESWETNVRFKILKMGNIQLFNGTSSCFKFNDTQNTGVNQLCLPNMSVTGQPNWSASFTSQTIALSNLRSTATGELTNELPLAWNTTYTGNATVTEQLYYMQNGAGGWVKFGELSGITKGMTLSTAALPITDLPPGGYQIKVYATASDAPDDTIILPNAVTLGGAGKYYIKLE